MIDWPTDLTDEQRKTIDALEELQSTIQYAPEDLLKLAEAVGVDGVSLNVWAFKVATHFSDIIEKLEADDRVSGVAAALSLGLMMGAELTTKRLEEEV